MRKSLLAFFFLLLSATCVMAAPVVTISSPANSATVNTTFTVTASATPDAGNTISGWEIYVDGTTVYHCTTGCTSSMSQSITVSAAAHTLVVRAWDSTASVSPNYGSKQISVTAVTSTITVTVATPVAASSVCSPVNITASATAVGSTPTGWSIYDLNNSGTRIYNTPGPVSSINVNLTMATGAQSLQIKAWDSAGGSSSTNVAFTVTTTGCGTGGGGGGGGTPPVTNLNPTTTVAAETACNTGAWSGFTDQANGDEGCHNVSLLPVHNLMYTANTTFVAPNVMLWWDLCGNTPQVSWTTHCNGHALIGYSSNDATHTHAQMDEIANLGYDGVEIDWYGRGTYVDAPQNSAAGLIVSDLNARSSGLGSNLKYFFMIDHSYTWSCGGSAWSSHGYASKTACIEGEVNLDMDYMNSHYWNGSHVYKYNGTSPVVIFFMSESATEFSGVDWATAWSVIRTHANGESNGSPIFLFENAGGFTHAQTSGAYDWVSPCKMNSTGYSCDGSGSTPQTWDQSGLDWFYSQANSNSSKVAMGAAWKGFDDRFASWSAPVPNNRFLDQNCGMTWVDTLAEPGKYYSSTKQLPFELVVTWNDYEEGTELESGVNNCYSLAGSVSGSTVNWSLSGSGNTATIDHYTVYASTDGINLAVLQDSIPASTTTLDLSSYTLSAGTYTIYVKLFSKSHIKTEMANVGTFSSTAVTSPPPTAALTVTPTSGTAPLSVSADVSASTGGSGESITKQVINWGDGSALVTLTATPWTASHTYTTAGAWTVTNTATNNTNLSSNATLTVSVAAADPSNATLSSQLADGAYVYSPLRVQGTITLVHGPIANARIIVDGTTVFDKAETGTTYSLDKYVFLSGGKWHTVKIEAVDSASPANTYDSQTLNVFCVGHSN